MWVLFFLFPILAYASSCVDTVFNTSAMGVLPPCYLAAVSYPVANIQTSQSYYFNATSTGSWLVGFTFRQDPGFWTLTNPSVTASVPFSSTQLFQNANLSQGGNIIVNGASVSAPLYFQVWFQAGQPPPAAGTWSPGQWYDGAVGTFDGIYQGIPVVQNTLYKISFFLIGTQPSNTNTIQLGVYALPCNNINDPVSACVPPSNLGFAVAIPDSVSPTPSISSSISLSKSATPQMTVSISSTSTNSLSTFNTPSISSTSSSSGSGSNSVSSSFQSTSSNSNSVSSSVQFTSSGSSSVCPTLSSYKSLSISSTSSSSKSNSKSLTMTTTTCPTPSIISALISATGTPLFLVTAYPTPSITPSLSLNATLGSIIASPDTIGTILGGVSLGVVGALGAALAALHLPRVSIPQNLLKNPIGTINKLVSDIKDPKKLISDLTTVTQKDDEDAESANVNVDSSIVVAPAPAPSPLPILSQAQKVIAQSFRNVAPPPTPVQPPKSAPPSTKPVSPTLSQKPSTPTPNPTQKPKQENNQNKKAKIELDLKDLPAIQAYLNSKKTQHKIVQ